MKRRVMVAAVLWAGWTGLAQAAPFGDAVSGREIAQRWCAACHVVVEDQPSALADVPTFAEVSRRYAGKMAILEAFLSQSHPQMPDMNLTYREIRDLVAYFESL